MKYLSCKKLKRARKLFMKRLRQPLEVRLQALARSR